MLPNYTSYYFRGFDPKGLEASLEEWGVRISPNIDGDIPAKGLIGYELEWGGEQCSLLFQSSQNGIGWEVTIFNVETTKPLHILRLLDGLMLSLGSLPTYDHEWQIMCDGPKGVECLERWLTSTFSPIPVQLKLVPLPHFVGEGTLKLGRRTVDILLIQESKNHSSRCLIQRRSSHFGFIQERRNDWTLRRITEAVPNLSLLRTRPAAPEQDGRWLYHGKVGA